MRAHPGVQNSAQLPCGVRALRSCAGFFTPQACRLHTRGVQVCTAHACACGTPRRCAPQVRVHTQVSARTWYPCLPAGHPPSIRPESSSTRILAWRDLAPDPVEGSKDVLYDAFTKSVWRLFGGTRDRCSACRVRGQR